LDARKGMMIGGASAIVATLAVAGSVVISNAAALSDQPGKALAESTVTVPEAIAHASPSATPVARVPAPITVPAPQPGKVAPVASAGTGSAHGTAGRTTSTAETGGSTTKGAGHESDAKATNAPSGKTQDTDAWPSRLRDHDLISRFERWVRSELSRESESTSSWHTQTPAEKAGSPSGDESPSSPGSKREQPSRTPDSHG